MKMGSSEGIGTIKPEGEIYTCPACGYTDGFHVSFNLLDSGGEAEIILICPSCNARFALGWKVRISPSG